MRSLIPLLSCSHTSSKALWKPIRFILYGSPTCLYSSIFFSFSRLFFFFHSFPSSFWFSCRLPPNSPPSPSSPLIIIPPSLPLFSPSLWLQFLLYFFLSPVFSLCQSSLPHSFISLSPLFLSLHNRPLFSSSLPSFPISRMTRQAASAFLFPSPSCLFPPVSSLSFSPSILPYS